jgi:hypothetical protein
MAKIIDSMTPEMKKAILQELLEEQQQQNPGTPANDGGVSFAVAEAQRRNAMFSGTNPEARKLM